MKLTLETELCVREEPDGQNMTTPKEVFDLVKDTGNLAQESFSVLTLNAKTKLIKRHLVSLGTVNSSLVHPREVFRPAILDGAMSVILVHNHPSGDPSPSGQDLRITNKLIEAGKMLEITILDHVIVAGDKFISMRESGIISF